MQKTVKINPRKTVGIFATAILILAIFNAVFIVRTTSGTNPISMKNGDITASSLNLNWGHLINVSLWNGFSFPNTFTMSVSGSNYYVQLANSSILYQGTNFTHVREQAVAYMVTQSGGEIKYTAGTYLTAKTLLTNSFITEIGEGMNAVTIQRTADVILFNYTEATGTNNQQMNSLQGMTLSGGNFAYTSDLIYIYQLKDSLFNELHITTVKNNGFYICGGSVNSFWNSYENLLMDNTVGQNQGSAFFLGNKALDSFIFNVYGGGWKYGIKNLGGATDWTVQRFWLTGFTNEFYFRSDSWFGAFYFSDIWLDMGSAQATGNAILLNATNADFGDISFENLFFIGSWTNLDLIRIDTGSGRYASDLYFLNLHGNPTRINSPIINWTGSGNVQSMTIDQNHIKGTNRYDGSSRISIHILNDDYYTETFTGLPFSYSIFQTPSNIYMVNQTTGNIDLTSSNMSLILNNASASLVANGGTGGIIFVTAMTVSLTATVQQYATVKIEGEGILSTVFNVAGDFNAFNISYAGDTNGTDWSLSDLQIDMQGHNGTAIYSPYASHISTQRNEVIENVRILNIAVGYSGIDLADLMFATIENTNIVGVNGTGIKLSKGNTLNSNVGEGHYTHNSITLGYNGSTGVLLLGNSSFEMALMKWSGLTVYVPASLSGNTVGLNLTGVTQSTFEQTDIENTNVSIFLGASGSLSTQDNTFTESRLYNSQNFTVWLASGSYQNTFIGGTWTTATSATGYIVKDGNYYGSDNRTFNLVEGVSLGSGLVFPGWATRIHDCPKYNPVGKIAKPWGNVNNLNISGASAYNSGPYNNTVTMIAQIDQFITVSGGSGVNVTILDANLNQIQTGLATLTQQYFPVGYFIDIVYTTTPTVNVYGT